MLRICIRVPADEYRRGQEEEDGKDVELVWEMIFTAARKYPCQRVRRTKRISCAKRTSVYSHWSKQKERSLLMLVDFLVALFPTLLPRDLSRD